MSYCYKDAIYYIFFIPLAHFSAVFNYSSVLFFYSFVHPTDVKLNFILPAFMSSLQQAMTVAPVVQTSSTMRICLPARSVVGYFLPFSYDRREQAGMHVPHFPVFAIYSYGFDFL